MEEATFSFVMDGPLTVRAIWTPTGSLEGLGALSSAIFGLGAIGLVFVALVFGRLTWRRLRRED